MEASYSRSGPRVATGYRLVFGYVGIFLMLIGAISMIPLFFLIIYPDEWRCYASFLITGLGTSAIGAVLYFTLIHKMEKGRLAAHEDALIIVLVWIFALLVGAFPFYLNQFFVHDLSTTYVQSASAYSFSESFFESTSGYTATGLTVYRDFLDSAYQYAFEAGYRGEEALAYANEYIAVNSTHIFLFYRSLSHFFGGVGLILIVATALNDKAGLRLFNTEGHGDQLLPSMVKTARLILLIYTCYIIFGTLSLWFFGMDWFEAFCHSTAAVATGGLSTRSTSMYFFINPDMNLVNFGTGCAVSVTDAGVVYTPTGLVSVFSSSVNTIGLEVVTCLLMILGATAFFLHMYLLRGRFIKFFRDCEVKLAVFMFVIFVPLMMVSMAYNNQYIEELNSHGAGFWDYFRFAAFQFISCMSTTGFSNVRDIVYLGQATLWISVIAMTVGGGVGSTGGAIKQYRVAVILKQIYWDLRYRSESKRMIYPKTVYYHGERKKVTEEEYNSASFFAILYVGVILIGGMIVSFLPNLTHGFGDGIYLFASALSGTGNSTISFLAYKANNPTAAYYGLLWILTLGMYLGRLEIIPVYSSIYLVSKNIVKKEA